MAQSSIRIAFAVATWAALIPALAHAAGPPPANQLLIVVGDPDEALARDKLEAWKWSWGGKSRPLELPPGFPKIIKSGDYAGLNPGYFIGVVGVCTKALAEQALPGLQAADPGAYVRTLKGKFDPMPCPTSTLAAYEKAGWTVEGPRTSGSLVWLSQGSVFEAVLVRDGGVIAAGKVFVLPEPEKFDNGPSPRWGEPQLRNGALVVPKSFWDGGTGCASDRTYAFTPAVTAEGGIKFSSTVIDSKTQCGE